MTAWEPTPPPNFYDPETAAKLKVLFAKALCRHVNAYDAAREIEPNAMEGRAHWIVANWLDDPDVVSERAKHVAQVGPTVAGLPNKEELALKIYNEAANVTDKSTKLAYFRAVADVMGYIPRGGGTNVNVNNNIVNQPKVQRVPVFATDEDWERKAKMVEARLEATAG